MAKCRGSLHGESIADRPPPLLRERRVVAFEREPGGGFLCRPSFETPAFGGGPQDDDQFRGEILDPHGEERRLRRVSNHMAEYATWANVTASGNATASPSWPAFKASTGGGTICSNLLNTWILLAGAKLVGWRACSIFFPANALWIQHPLRRRRIFPGMARGQVAAPTIPGSTFDRFCAASADSSRTRRSRAARG